MWQANWSTPTHNQPPSPFPHLYTLITKQLRKLKKIKDELKSIKYTRSRLQEHKKNTSRGNLGSEKQRTKTSKQNSRETNPVYLTMLKKRLYNETVSFTAREDKYFNKK